MHADMKNLPMQYQIDHESGSAKKIPLELDT